MHTVTRWSIRAAMAFIPAMLGLLSSPAVLSGAEDAPAVRQSRPRNIYAVEPLVSDDMTGTPFQDAHLINPWGLARGPAGPFWVANNGTGTATLYDGDGVANPLVVSLPTGAAPTGIAFNIDDAFEVRDGEDFGPSFFLFAGEDGRISGWNPAVPRGVPSPVAFVVHDASASGAIYKGLAVSQTGAGDRLYATDFHNRRIDVLDAAFRPVALPSEAFVDERIPDGFSPFGIQNIHGRIFVTYAKRDAGGEDDVPGHGLGFVDAFDTDGLFLARIATRGRLNAPWGLAMAPEGFGRFAGDLLVGNFGDGRILAYRISDDLRGAHFDGVLSGSDGRPITIDGLWALGFGNNLGAGSSDELFFTAGPVNEEHGLFGKIRPY